jgi:hypothetical protein
MTALPTNNEEQPYSLLVTTIEKYFEAVYMYQTSKPGSAQESYWQKKVKDLNSKTDELIVYIA